ncbi:TolB-like translocation protein [Dyella flagellata]|uniref:Translocation protein TolB n=1 Tax=Dyella flagellata TaxID=1867833 RepID=A0ABQ5XEN2_9GAMM|nr:hypothetical protein [Dyella flagellata]GLQ89068.1 hypothetical protein GCM10007898_26400 [Dyella flagellata]
MRLFLRASVAAMLTCASATVAYADGTILFTRPVNGFYNGTRMPLGSGLFTIEDSGTQLRQLTPLAPGSYSMPSGVAYLAGPANNLLTGYWPTRNFSPDGRSIQYFAGRSSNPTSGGPYDGKYRVMDRQTGLSKALFPGHNDNAPPGVGYLAWGPEGSNEIAYTDSTSEIPVTTRCVYLMHPDGSGRHRLWCAPAEVQTSGGPTPTLAVESLRWAGNGKSLLAYVAWGWPIGSQPGIGGSSYASLYQIDVRTGAAREVASLLSDPPSGDVSYDGTKVLYQQYDLVHCGDFNYFRYQSVDLCVKDMNTGKVTDLFPQNVWENQLSRSWWSDYWYAVALLSPDGSKVAFTMPTTDGAEGALYTIDTDGTHLRQVTPEDPHPPAGVHIAWIPAAWSPDGKQILVNRTMTPASSRDQTLPSEVHIIALSDGRDWRVTDGYAIDWLKPPRPGMIK